MASRSLKEGWIAFPEFCRKYHIDLRGGNAYKRLNSPLYYDQMKENITPNSTKPNWVVNEDYAKNRFKV